MAQNTSTIETLIIAGSRNPNSNATSSFLRHSWIVCISFELLFIFASVWAALSFIVYGRRKAMWRRVRCGANDEDRTASRLLAMATTAAFATVPRFLVNVAHALVGRHLRGDFLCELTLDLGFAAFYFATTAIFLFLWYRQRALYGTPTLRPLHTLPVKIFARGFLVLLFVVGPAILVVIIVPDYDHMSEVGCGGASEEQQRDAGNRFVAAAAYFVTCQAVLLGLFWYPLRAHQHAVRRLHASRGNGLAERIVAATRRAVTCTIVCALSDVAAMLVGFVALPASIPTAIVNLVYDVGLVVNVASVMFSFESRAEIAGALFRCRRSSG